MTDVAAVAADIPVRRMPFDFRPDVDLVFIKEDPKGLKAHVHVALVQQVRDGRSDSG